jgi:hypothetical protein
MNFVKDFPRMLGRVPGVTFSVVKNGRVMSEHPGAAVIEVHAAGNPERSVMFAECPNHPWLYHLIVPEIWRHVLNGPDVSLLGDPASGGCGASGTFKACVLESDPSWLARFLAMLS